MKPERAVKVNSDFNIPKLKIKDKHEISCCHLSNIEWII